MNNLPNCVPQEQYKLDEVFSIPQKNWEKAGECPGCGSEDFWSYTYLGEEGIYITKLECDDCDYRREE